jgi:hypothetical protein
MLLLVAGCWLLAIAEVASCVRKILRIYDRWKGYFTRQSAAVAANSRGVGFHVEKVLS